MLKGKTPLVIAVILAVLAALLVLQTIEREKKKAREGWNLVPVVVAQQEVTEGTTLDYDMVAKMQMPEQFATPSVVKPDQLERVIGQKLMVDLQAGDLILWSHFRTEGAFDRLSTIVRKQGRALTLDISGAAAVGGWVRPNDIVDILGTFQDPKTNQMVTVTLLKSVIVLATGTITGTTNVQNLEKGELGYSNVTLMVLPQEAEMVVLASQLGQLHMTLRNPEDIIRAADDSGEPGGRSKATIENLMTGDRAKDLQIQRLNTFQVIRLQSGGPGGGR